jgi:hypothetical protein
MIYSDTKFTNHHQKKTCKLIKMNWFKIKVNLITLIFYSPVIPDLNCYGEVVTLIDPNADVIKDPAVQRILKGLDGERTVVSFLILLYR